ncbi:MAG TPA: phosphoribosyltransferase family protein [Balneolaceae bacterium]
MSRNRVERSIKRIACEISEAHTAGARLILFGIEDRGFAVARTLTDHLVFFDEQAEAVQLPREHSDEVFKKLKVSKNEQFIAFIVDDVIFSGKTMFSALTAVERNLHPSEMHTVALVDRGHRKFPVKAEFYGMELPTKLNEYVSLKMKEDQITEVLLTK